MPTLPDDIVMQPFKGVNWLVQSRIIVTRTFQKVMGELGMGRFISYSGRTAPVTDIYDTLLDRLCRAYAVFIGLQFILNYAGDFIYRSKVLRPWFEHWETAASYFKAREGQRWRQVSNPDWTSYRDLVLANTGYSKPLYDHFNPRESLLNVERYKAGRILEMYDFTNPNPQALAELMETTLADTALPDNFFYIQSETVPLVSVFIGMDVFILFSNVYLLEIYRKAVKVRRDQEHIPAWLKHQSARITDTADFKAKEYFDDLGKIKVTIPQTGQFPHLAILDTYALKLYLDLSKLPTTQAVYEAWGLYPPEPPAMTLAVLELWGVPSEPPTMTLAVFEDWGFEPSEPPAMTQKVYEPWGVEAPAMTQKVYEPWGYLSTPPAMTQKVYEPWTS